MQGEDRRVFRRSESFHCEARVSKDKAEWRRVDVRDLSGEGLRFRSGEQFDVGELLWFELNVTGFLTSLDFSVRGEIRHKRENTYGVSFKDLSHDRKIFIDEAMRNFQPKQILY